MFSFNSTAPSQQLFGNVRNLNSFSDEQLVRLMSTTMAFISQDPSATEEVNQFATGNGVNPEALNRTVRGVLLFFMEALKTNLAPGAVKDDLIKLGLQESKAELLCVEWKQKFADVIGKTLNAMFEECDTNDTGLKLRRLKRQISAGSALRSIAEGLTCQICLELALDAHTACRQHHVFCATCLGRWLAQHNSCPVCRAVTSRASMHPLRLANNQIAVLEAVEQKQRGQRQFGGGRIIAEIAPTERNSNETTCAGFVLGLVGVPTIVLTIFFPLQFIFPHRLAPPHLALSLFVPIVSLVANTVDCAKNVMLRCLCCGSYRPANDTPLRIIVHYLFMVPIFLALLWLQVLDPVMNFLASDAEVQQYLTQLEAGEGKSWWASLTRFWPGSSLQQTSEELVNKAVEELFDDVNLRTVKIAAFVLLKRFMWSGGKPLSFRLFLSLLVLLYGGLGTYWLRPPQRSVVRRMEISFLRLLVTMVGDHAVLSATFLLLVNNLQCVLLVCFWGWDWYMGHSQVEWSRCEWGLDMSFWLPPVNSCMVAEGFWHLFITYTVCAVLHVPAFLGFASLLGGSRD